MRSTGSVSPSLLLGAVLLVGSGCSDDAGPSAPAGTLQVIQAAERTAVIDVLVDGDVVIPGLAAGAVSPAVSVPAGLREISFRPVSAAASAGELQLSVVADSTYTTVVIDSANVLEPTVLADTGSVPAAGRTKLRVGNFAALAGPIDVYRRQPDFDGILTLAFPFTYQLLSNYVESDPGDWQVLIATEARVNGVPPDVPQDTLLIVDPVSLAGGQASTVVIIDKPGGGLDAVIVRDR
ncbi:MAG TPA: DUF4397 domain-containing protein [Thermopolyspora sp.]